MSYCVYEHRAELTKQLEVRLKRCMRNMSPTQIAIHDETIDSLRKNITRANDLCRVLDSIKELTSI